MTPAGESEDIAGQTSVQAFEPVRRITITIAICALTLLGFFVFPGHTFLQSDTQIYMPILEHIMDPTVLARDPIAVHQHVAYTVYDEVTIALRVVTQSGLEQALTIQQIAFRALGLLGVFWIATSLGLSARLSLLVASIFSLGATIVGPAVLSIEYEPIPRGFAVALIVLAIGLAAHGRVAQSALAASVATLYHPPTAIPFWAIFGPILLWKILRRQERRQAAIALVMLAGSLLTLFVISRLQAGGAESQNFLSRLGPEQERLMRLRAPYIWVSDWAPDYIGTYLFLWAVTAGAVYRLLPVMKTELRAFALGLPVLGLLAMPSSWLLLEKLHWAFIPQAQPARAVLFVTVFAIVLSAAAGARAAVNRRVLESFAWFLVSFAPAANPNVIELFRPVTSVLRLRANIIVALAMIAVLVARLEMWRRAAAAIGVVAVAMLAAWSIPVIGAVRNHPYLHDAQIYSLAAWAETSTPADSVFHFPDASHDLYPGIFRARSMRAVYVDWKGGGQMNFLRSLGELWWTRWSRTMTTHVTAADLVQYGTLGVDYVVLQASHAIQGLPPAYQNARYVVYRLKPDTLVRNQPTVPCIQDGQNPGCPRSVVGQALSPVPARTACAALAL